MLTTIICFKLLLPPNSGVMRMFNWNRSVPKRDGDYENGIVIHEFTHGISNRLTGGRLNVGCLPDGEPGGMGEGWSDVLATILRLKSSDNRLQQFVMGAYALNYAPGI